MKYHEIVEHELLRYQYRYSSTASTARTNFTTAAFSSSRPPALQRDPQADLAQLMSCYHCREKKLPGFGELRDRLQSLRKPAALWPPDDSPSSPPQPLRKTLALAAQARAARLSRRAHPRGGNVPAGCQEPRQACSRDRSTCRYRQHRRKARGARSCRLLLLGLTGSV